MGKITPILKKQKPHSNPDSYRRITVNSIIGKIIDKKIVPPTRQALLPYNNIYQFGFKKNISCQNAALVLTETLMEAKDTKTPIYVAYMDTSKAFDMVNHSELLCSIHSQGITGPLWNILNNSYANIKSVVKWQGNISSSFNEAQGISQGGHTSADLFNCRANPMLNKISTHSDGFSIGYIKTGSIMVADDIAITSKTPHGLQNLILIAEQDAAHQTRPNYKYQTKKKCLQRSSSTKHQLEYLKKKLTSALQGDLTCPTNQQ